VADKRLILCPYCGNTQNEPEDRCDSCGGFFDGLSLKVTQEHMGPWFMRDRHNPFRPGMSYDVLKREIEKGRIRPTTIIKGPTTRQFWSVARNVPGVAHLVGYCHACGAHVKANDDNCSECGEVFFAPKLRDNLGLAPLGADVQAKRKLSADGAFAGGKPGEQKPAAASAAAPAAAGPPSYAASTGLTLPGSAPAAAPQTSDQPVGSSILAGLRSDQAPDRDAAAVGQATQHANASRDAMAWMTPGANQEPDTLATAGDATAPLPKQSNPMTWILIGVNVLLFSIAAVAVVIVITRGGAPDTPAPVDRSQTPGNVSNGSASNGSDTPTVQPTPNGNGDGETELADPTGTGVEDDDDDQAQPQPEPADPDADARQRWTDEFDRAIKLEEDGRLKDALNALNRIKDNAPAEVQPGGLNDAIDRISRKIKKAELDALFE